MNGPSEHGRKPHDSEDLSAPGFIYGAYQAAGQAGHQGSRQADHNAAMTKCNGASVSSYDGGCLSSVSFGEAITRGGSFPTRSGGGVRGRVNGLSRSSRRNLLRRSARIDRDALAASGVRMMFVTLTYSGERWPPDPSACKAHLRAFLKRLGRRHGDCAAYWRMGVQKRGAWHFHLVVYLWPPHATLEELRRFVSSAWYEVTGKASEGHLRAGTSVEEVRRWKAETSHAERYLARKEGFPEGVATGRVWGAWREGLLPVRPELVAVSLKDAYRIRRIYRRLARRRGTARLNRTTVFVRHENVRRLLAFLGYRLE